MFELIHLFCTIRARTSFRCHTYALTAMLYVMTLCHNACYSLTSQASTIICHTIQDLHITTNGMILHLFFSVNSSKHFSLHSTDSHKLVSLVFVVGQLQNISH